jgi:transposase
MQRAHKIRLNPTPEQQAYFRKAAGTARFVYNWGLSEVKRALDDGRTPDSALDLKARFNTIKREQFPWVYAVTKCVVEGAFRNLGAALANFLSSKRGAQGQADQVSEVQAQKAWRWLVLPGQRQVRARRTFDQHPQTGSGEPERAAAVGGQVVDRDLNAARNIRDEALKLSAVPGVATSAR